MSRMSASGLYVGQKGEVVCAQTGRVLGPGQGYVAVLVEKAGEEDLERVNYGLDVWEDGVRPSAEVGAVVAVWKTRVREAGSEKKPRFDEASLIDLFEQLGEQTDEKRVALRFVLMLMLVRKRALVCESAKDGVWLVRRKGEKAEEGDVSGLMEVRDPGLGEDALAAVAEQLDKVLEGAEVDG